MISESPAESADPNTRTGQSTPGRQAYTDHDSPEVTANPPATVIVRGEAVRDPQAVAAAGQPRVGRKEMPTAKQSRSESRQEISPAKVEMKDRLPALDDDGDVGLEKKHLVMRDDKPDLTFTGTLLASAAPTPPIENSWEEYRIYATDGGKHVFSKVARSVLATRPDRHEAEVFDPAPSSMPAQLLRSAHDLTHSKPMKWTDAAVSFFGYNPLSKVLYRKLGPQFDEQIS